MTTVYAPFNCHHLVCARLHTKVTISRLTISHSLKPHINVPSAPTSVHVRQIMLLHPASDCPRGFLEASNTSCNAALHTGLRHRAARRRRGESLALHKHSPDARSRTRSGAVQRGRDPILNGPLRGRAQRLRFPIPEKSGLTI